MNTSLLKELEFELAYLSCLTKEGIKPLSRWEKDFNSVTESVLKELGLRTRAVERTVQSGLRVRELLFSTSNEYLEVYVTRFAGQPVSRSPEVIRLEGHLFGYPSCCVESYVAHGYARNSLRRREQRILFHWACPWCAVTPRLVPEYRRVYRACRAARRGCGWPVAPLLGNIVLGSHLRRTAALASSLAALGFLPVTLPTASADGQLDPHWIALPSYQDPDADFLASNEEFILGMNPDAFDENGNAIPDGVDLAQLLSASIDALPGTPSDTKTYVQHHLAFGLENCQVCGAITNMGSLEIINPLENQSFSMPYVAKHFLEHGSFSYTGTNDSGILHSGRLNPALLKTVLTSQGLAHLIAEPVGTDQDLDGLRDWEELELGTKSELPDTDGDHLLDGIDLARSMLTALEKLPREVQPDQVYVLEHPMDGIDTCPRCGERVVMGTFDVINPVSSDAITISSMAWHYMEHGGFRWEGGYLLGGKGRVDPRQLQAVLTGKPNRHVLALASDADHDQLTDTEEHALGKDPGDLDQDHNTVLDGLDLARAVIAEVAALPTKPSSNAVYRLDFMLRGLEVCDICGTSVNMGHLVVCNPVVQLYATVPYIALHFMEHDSFSFAGDVHGKGRTDIKLLLDALRSTGPNHLVQVPGDTDFDGLKDVEEPHFGTNPGNPDTDGDGIGDGVALSRRMCERIKSLPGEPLQGGTYAIHHDANCFAPCPVCNETVNCGFLEITNSWTGQCLRISYMNMHYLEQGSFAVSTTERVDPLLLDAILRPAVIIQATDAEVKLRWSTQAGHVYELSTAQAISGPWTLNSTFQGDGNEIVFTESKPAGPLCRFYKLTASEPGK